MDMKGNGGTQSGLVDVVQETSTDKSRTESQEEEQLSDFISNNEGPFNFCYSWGFLCAITTSAQSNDVVEK